MSVLTTLPQELLDNISSRLGANDVQALSSSCSGLNEKIQNFCEHDILSANKEFLRTLHQSISLVLRNIDLNNTADISHVTPLMKSLNGIKKISENIFPMLMKTKGRGLKEKGLVMKTVRGEILDKVLDYIPKSKMVELENFYTRFTTKNFSALHKEFYKDIFTISNFYHRLFSGVDDDQGMDRKETFYRYYSNHDLNELERKICLQPSKTTKEKDLYLLTLRYAFENKRKPSAKSCEKILSICEKINSKGLKTRGKINAVKAFLWLRDRVKASEVISSIPQTKEKERASSIFAKNEIFEGRLSSALNIANSLTYHKFKDRLYLDLINALMKKGEILVAYDLILKLSPSSKKLGYIALIKFHAKNKQLLTAEINFNTLTLILASENEPTPFYERALKHLFKGYLAAKDAVKAEALFSMVRTTRNQNMLRKALVSFYLKEGKIDLALSQNRQMSEGKFKQEAKLFITKQYLKIAEPSKALMFVTTEIQAIRQRLVGITEIGKYYAKKGNYQGVSDLVQIISSYINNPGPLDRFYYFMAKACKSKNDLAQFETYKNHIVSDIIRDQL